MRHALLLLAAFFLCRTAPAQTTLEVVPAVDLPRYAGTWYEVARTPNRFQNDCAGNVTATYRLLDDGEIEVINRCRRADGTPMEAVGRARQQDADGPTARLEVRFAPAFLSFLPMVWGDYWIIQLPDDYSYSVIGGPTREYLWILARTPALSADTLAVITARLREQGYDPALLQFTTHGP